MQDENIAPGVHVRSRTALGKEHTDHVKKQQKVLHGARTLSMSWDCLTAQLRQFTRRQRPPYPLFIQFRRPRANVKTMVSTPCSMTQRGTLLPSPGSRTRLLEPSSRLEWASQASLVRPAHSSRPHLLLADSVRCKVHEDDRTRAEQLRSEHEAWTDLMPALGSAYRNGSIPATPDRPNTTRRRHARACRRPRRLVHDHRRARE